MGFAALAVPLWVLALNGYLVDFAPASGWLNWHQHELIFGFALAIISGFLLTAVQAWTGQPSLLGAAAIKLICHLVGGAWCLVIECTLSLVSGARELQSNFLHRSLNEPLGTSLSLKSISFTKSKKCRITSTRRKGTDFKNANR